MKKNNLSKYDVVPIAGFAIIYLSLLLFVRDRYYQLMLVLVPTWAVLGISWNIISGYSGLISFGHAAFFGLGAYTVAICLTTWGITPWLGIPIATLVGGIAGLVIGWPTFRLRGHYFALAMLAYPLGLLYVFEWMGFQEVSIPMMRGNPIYYMQFEDYRIYGLIVLAVLLLSLVLSLRIERSRFGLSLLAIKQNEVAAQAAGINVLRQKLKAICLSGAIAGMIGGYYAIILLIVTPPSVFGMLTSAQALIVSLFGGIGVAWGPVLGSAILIPLGETLHAEFGSVLPGISGVVYGAAIIAIILVAPEGIYWKIRDLFFRPHTDQQPRSWVERRSSLVGGSPRTPLPYGEVGKRRSVLRVENLSKEFGGLRAVSDVSFEVPEGTIVGIIGPNGAGKTTLFNLLNGIYRPTHGRVLLGELELTKLSPDRICRAGIGRTFQVVRPFARLSVLENVKVGAFVASHDDREAEELSRKALEIVGLVNDAHLVAGGLTGKQLRLMELARALAGQPKVLLLDEILAGLGREDVEDLIEIIGRVATLGITIVIIEHTMHAMVRLADKFIVLDNGSLLAEGPPREVIKQKEVIEAYLGTKWSATANA